MSIPTLRWGERTYLMGVVNVTADSFSGDGLVTPGRTAEEVVRAAVTQGTRFAREGADIIDVGAESTRPAQFYGQHEAIDEEREATLAIPVVRALAAGLGDRTLVSIDTTKGSVARSALHAGASIVNDVWGGRRDPETAEAAAEHGAYFVVMHNQERSGYPDGVFEAVVRWLGGGVAAAADRGVPLDRIIVDPGIGFGKTPDESLELLHRLAELKEALDGRPLLVGTSRKRFIGELLDGALPDDRVEGTAASVALAVAAGADIVRVHDVAHIARTLRVSDAIVRRATAPS